MNAQLGNTTATEFYTPIHFVVAVDNVKYGAFSECTLPNLSVKTEDIREGGQNSYTHKLPVSVDVGTLTLKRGLTPNTMFYDWYKQVMMGNIKDATRQVTIMMFNGRSEVLATWNLRDAYPIKWKGPSLNAQNSAIAIEEIELVHHGFEMT
jgi:phage tail-like protein